MRRSGPNGPVACACTSELRKAGIKDHAGGFLPSGEFRLGASNRAVWAFLLR